MLGRLTGYAATNESQSFQYDANGNRTAKTDNGVNTLYGIQTNSNRLLLAGNHPQTLDANGNVLNDGVHTYTYNAQNRLASVDGTTTYTYNADEQRVKKVSGQTTTLYAWDNDRIIGEYVQGANGLQASETIYMGSTPIALIQQAKTYRIHADQIDTPRVLSDASGKMVWSWESKPFGETKPNEDPDQDGVALRYNQRFLGQTYDAETGLHYNFHRDYNPQTGRYVQSDPIGLEGGMNGFGYVGQNPMTNVDSLGYASTKVASWNRYIDVSIDAHNASEIAGAEKLMKKYTNINFTVYTYTSSSVTGAKAVGFHANPVDDSEATMLKKIQAIPLGRPASIHGSAGNRLTSKEMAALKNRKVPFVRAAGNTGSTAGSPPVVLTFSAGHTLATIEKDRSIGHYFVHTTNLGARVTEVLDYFNAHTKN